MPIAGDRPETGVRIALERDPARREAPFTYRGAAYVPDGSYPCEVTVSAEGAVDVRLDAGGPELAEKIRLIVRTVWRQSEGEPPAWRITRWRGDK